MVHHSDWWSRTLGGAVIVLATLGGAPAYASGEIAWGRSFGTLGPAADAARAVATDVDGSVYVAGAVGGALPGQVSADQSDAFLRKYDSTGHEVWTRQFGTPGSDQAHGVVVDPSGVYVVGHVTGVLPGQTRTGGTDAFVLKFDRDGNEIWTRQFGALLTQAFGVAADASGVYVVGGVTPAFEGQSPAGGTDAFVRKYDHDGSVLWTRQFGAAGSDQALAVSVDPSGVYVAGFLTPGPVPTNSQAFVKKYDVDGNELWSQQFGASGSNRAAGVSADATGIYVVGNAAFPPSPSIAGPFVRKYDADGVEVWTRQLGFGFSQAFGVSAGPSGVYVVGSSSAPSSSGFDAFVRLYDPTGVEVATTHFGTPEADQALGVAVHGSTVFLVGSVNGILSTSTVAPLLTGRPDAFVRSYDAPLGAVQWAQEFGTIGPQDDVVHGVASLNGHVYVAGWVGGALPGQSGADGLDAFVRKYDSHGHELWTRQFGTDGNDGAFGVAVHASGVYVVGFVGGALPGQVAAGAGDAFVRKFDADGHELWTHQFGTPFTDAARGVAVDDDGVYVVGSVGGALPDQSGLGATDAFLRKYDHAGYELWTRQFGTVDSDRAEAVTIERSDVYVVGSVSGALEGQSYAGSLDAFVRKFDRQGHALWTRQFGTQGLDEALGVAADASGVYVAGGVATSPFPPLGPGTADAFVRKYDVNGGELWVRQFGAAPPDRARAVAVDESGVYVAGVVASGIPGQMAIVPPTAFVRKYDIDGGELWTRQVGTPRTDEAFGVSADVTGVYFGGRWASDDAFVAGIVDAIAVGLQVSSGINLRSRGTVSVVMASTAEFDATQVDPSTVLMAGAGVRLRSNGTPMASASDVNGDGLPDLVLHFAVQDLQITEADTEVVLFGRTFGGARIRGTASVRVTR